MIFDGSTHWKLREPSDRKTIVCQYRLMNGVCILIEVNFILMACLFSVCFEKSLRCWDILPFVVRAQKNSLIIAKSLPSIFRISSYAVKFRADLQISKSKCISRIIKKTINSPNFLLVAHQTTKRLFLIHPQFLFTRHSSDDDIRYYADIVVFQKVQWAIKQMRSKL